MSSFYTIYSSAQIAFIEAIQKNEYAFYFFRRLPNFYFILSVYISEGTRDKTATGRTKWQRFHYYRLQDVLWNMYWTTCKERKKV